ncbi:FYN-binding protein 2-like [Cyanistes caeruleus]|uniref:FYN-binding protein 2-like n=1 Tax=Cyanistes caeruleus TaxID=156563 RepID=UPI000CDA15E0|nr:FYN-binding protein 2-like [Cyanistes caeruleus]
MKVGDFLSLLDHKNVHHNNPFHDLIPGTLNANQRPIFQVLTTELLCGAALTPLFVLCKGTGQEDGHFKFKKSSEEKGKKMDKEEKLFRETFMYHKEIRVLARASAGCSVASQRRADLPLTAGEQLDVIEAVQGHAVICRNAQGRYGYVLLEHLNFR